MARSRVGGGSFPEALSPLRPPASRRQGPARLRALQHNRKPVHGLSGRVRFCVPDRREGVANVELVNLDHGNLSQLGLHMQRERREPPASLAVFLELCFPRFEGIARNVRQNVNIALGVPAFLFPGLYRVLAGLRQLTPFGRVLPDLRKAQRTDPAMTHLAASAMYGHPQYPLTAPVFPAMQPKPAPTI